MVFLYGWGRKETPLWDGAMRIRTGGGEFGTGEGSLIPTSPIKKLLEKIPPINPHYNTHMPHATNKIPTRTKPQVANRDKSNQSRITQLRKSPGSTTVAGAASANPNKPLTVQQKMFVKFWAEGESITSASVRAGYSDGATFAYRLVKMPNVIALYNEEKRLYAEASQMTRKKVMDMLIEAYDTAKLLSEPASMVSAAREIGKMCGMYNEVKKVEVSVTGDIMMNKMNQLSDEDLVRLISEGVQQAAAEDQDTLLLEEG